jgi:hypothetical protein
MSKLQPGIHANNASNSPVARFGREIRQCRSTASFGALQRVITPLATEPVIGGLHPMDETAKSRTDG